MLSKWIWNLSTKILCQFIWFYVAKWTNDKYFLFLRTGETFINCWNELIERRKELSKNIEKYCCYQYSSSVFIIFHMNRILPHCTISSIFFENSISIGSIWKRMGKLKRNSIINVMLTLLIYYTYMRPLSNHLAEKIYTNPWYRICYKNLVEECFSSNGFSYHEEIVTKTGFYWDFLPVSSIIIFLIYSFQVNRKKNFEHSISFNS